MAALRLFRMFRRLALAGLAAALLLPVAAMAERIALVVGNARYEHIPSLATPAEDTRAVAEALRRLDFEVTLLSDVSSDMFNVVLDAFAKDARGADAVLFYYAGHAFQDNGVNRLVPVDATLATTDALAAETWSMNDIAARIAGSGSTLIFLDACRTSPVPEAVRGSAAPAQGLADFDTPAGTFVSFSTRPGAVSYDQGEGRHSPYAEAFLANVERPGQSVSDLMIKVRSEVEVATVGRQVPWDQSSLREQFYFAGKDATADAADPGSPAAPAEDADLLALMNDIVVDDTQQLGPAPGSEPAPSVTADTGPDPVEPETPVADADPPPAAPARLAAAAVARPAIQAISGGQALQAGSATALTRATPQGQLHLAPVVSAPSVAAVPGKAITSIDPSGDPAAQLPPVPEDLPRALQEELHRVGCYNAGIDGDWGQGSRNAVRRYLEAKKSEITDEALEPSEALWRGLKDEKAEVCAPLPPEPVVAKKAPQKAKPAAKPAAKKTATAKKPPPAPAPAPAPVKRKPKCTFMVVAIVCK